MVSYHDCRLGFHPIELRGELLDHYACPLQRGAQLTALPLNSGRVQNVHKVSLLEGPGIDFQDIIPLHPLLRSAKPSPGGFMSSLQRPPRRPPSQTYPPVWVQGRGNRPGC